MLFRSWLGDNTSVSCARAAGQSSVRQSTTACGKPCGGRLLWALRMSAVRSTCVEDLGSPVMPLIPANCCGYPAGGRRLSALAPRGARARLGVNNVFDLEPPLADETYGYYGGSANVRGRQITLELSRTF